jgi:hypothetical protein
VKQGERVFLNMFLHMFPGTSAGIVLALLLAAFCGQASAQNANSTQLQKETEDLKAQLDALEGKINLKKVPTPQTPPVGDKAPAPTPPQSSPDTHLHLGGVTITPGGFLELDGLARQRGQ